MLAYVIQIRRDPLGNGPPTFEAVCCLADDQRAALALVKTALRLENETIQIARTLTEQEARAFELKPFQVRQMR